MLIITEYCEKKFDKTRHLIKKIRIIGVIKENIYAKIVKIASILYMESVGSVQNQVYSEKSISQKQKQICHC